MPWRRLLGNRIKRIKFEFVIDLNPMVRRLFSIVIALPLLTGCPEGGYIRENETVNRWIYSTMEENYLWSAEMPGDWEMHVESHPETFFQRLLYTVEGQIDYSDFYSTLYYTGDSEYFPAYDEDTEYGIEAVTYDFGMGFYTVSVGGLVHFQVAIVASGSPAYNAGVRRGDCFHTVDGRRLAGDSELISIMENQATVEIDFFYPEQKTVTLCKAYYSENPIQYHTVFELAPVTGYLSYSNFSDGNNDSYYTQLRSVFAGFVAAGVENIILDLRCNGGGELTAARKLCSLLAPPADLGGIYLYKERNSSFGVPGQFESETLYGASQMNGYNCGDISLYILTNKGTASASELVIHCLRPLYDNSGLKFMHLGDETEGKNVGGMMFANSRYEWEFYAITLRVHNIDRVSGYEAGLVPDRKVAEMDTENPLLTEGGEYVCPVGDWGDLTGDRILQATLDEIYGYGGWASLVPVEDAGDGTTRALAAPVSGVTATEKLTVKSRPLTEKSIRTGW